MSTAVERFDDKARDTFDRIGQTEVYEGELLRHRVCTRFLHWMVALLFFLAMFTGFGIYLLWLFRWFTPVFGGGPLSRLMHPWFGLGFVVFFGLQMLNRIKPMAWTPADTRWMKNLGKIVGGKEKMEPPETGFFNGGQKAQFWEIVAGCAVLPDHWNHSLVRGSHIRTLAGRHQLCAPRYFRSAYAGRHFHSHLPQHHRRARYTPSHDPRRGERSLGLDFPSCVVQRSYRARSGTSLRGSSSAWAVRGQVAPSLHKLRVFRHTGSPFIPCSPGVSKSDTTSPTMLPTATLGNVKKYGCDHPTQCGGGTRSRRKGRRPVRLRAFRGCGRLNQTETGSSSLQSRASEAAPRQFRGDGGFGRRPNGRSISQSGWRISAGGR